MEYLVGPCLSCGALVTTAGCTNQNCPSRQVKASDATVATCSGCVALESQLREREAEIARVNDGTHGAVLVAVQNMEGWKVRAESAESELERLRQRESFAAGMEWTSTPPTEPGWYWHRFVGHKIHLPCKAYYDNAGYFIVEARLTDSSCGTEFWPIPITEPPGPIEPPRREP